MPQIVQQGQINIDALNVPDLIVQIIPPQLLINGVPSNIVGFVGTAQWGPTNVPIIVGSYQQYYQQFGLPQPRKYDMGTALWAATEQGAQSFRCVRVTDGTDTAASIVIQTNCLTLTSKYTGSLGSSIQFIIQPGSLTGSVSAVVVMGSQVPEVFNNISEGVSNFTIGSAGTYTVCPVSLTIGAPQLPGGVQAVAYPILNMTGQGTIGGTMTGYAVNDTVVFGSNGVQIKVLTVSSGAIATYEVLNTGTVLAGNAVPSGAMAQTSTTGSGTGATLTATAWGLGQPVIETVGSGYNAVPSVTIVGGTESVAGSLTAVISYWDNIAAAINNGISGLRGPSVRVVATAGSGTATPTDASYTLVGGTDGANPANIGVQGTPALIGQDTIPRTGMYAMRASNIAMGVLVDDDDSTTWSTQTTFGLSEGIYMIGTGPQGDSIENAVTVLANAGIDSFCFKLMFGDWIYIDDPVTGAERLISPQGFIVGVMGNQSPEQSPLNKEMFSIVGTQKSQTGIQYTNADLQALSTGRIDVISNPCPGGPYFGCRIGINTSSNLAVNGDNYTRLTFFIAETLANGCGFYVGQLQTQNERYEAQTTIAGFLFNLKFLGMIGTADGSPCYEVQINDANNPFSLVSLGYQFAYVAVTYLSVIRYFVVNLQGGQTVSISDSFINTGSNATSTSQAPTIG